MKHSLKWAAAYFNKPEYFCSLQIVTGVVSANAAAAVQGHLQALGHIAADPISHRIGEEILHSIPVLARLGGDLDVNLLTASLAGAVVGALLTTAGSGLRKLFPGRKLIRTLGEPASMGN